jgi:protein O-GlcNAc transferase
MKFDFGDPELIRGMEHYLCAEWSEAEKAFLGLKKKYPESTYILLMLGEIYYSTGRLDESLAMYKKSLEINPDNTLFHYKMGVTEYRAGRLEEALASFEKVKDTDTSNHAMASYFVGLISFFLGDEKRSEQGFEELKKVSNESMISNYFLAQIKIKNNKLDEAIPLLEELLAITPGFAEIYYFLADAYYRSHDIAKAIRCARKAVELNPNDRRSAAMLEYLTMSV